MTSNELRIGNYVEIDNPKHWSNLKDIPVCVNAISCDNFFDDYQTISVKNNNDLTYNQLIKFIKPIPLTEEWLGKLGFIRNEKDMFLFTKNMDLIILGCENDYNGLWHGRIESVHQLQNLYYALTNEELIIKNQ
jgi:hypothetical protein